MTESYISVVTQELITCGTLLGPLPLTSGSPDSLAVLTWRCIDKLPISKQVLKVSLREQNNSRSLPKTPPWLAHILPARNPEEQNLEVIVKGGQLYFRALRDIIASEELRAWFGQDLVDILKLPMIPPSIVEGEKRFECMLCQEQFENPFPVVAHLMYRCRRKDQGVTPVQNPFRKKNGGRVKNFDIATLTDMNDSEITGSEEHNSPPPTISTNVSKLSPKEALQEVNSESSNKRKKKLENIEEYLCAAKRPKTDTTKSNETALKLDKKGANLIKTQSSAFKISSSPGSVTYHPPIYTGVDLHPTESNSSSAFKKVDKSSNSFHSNISSVSSLFPGTLDPREILFQAGSNNFSPFPYPITPVTSSPPCGGVTPSQNGINAIPHPTLTSPSIDVHMTSAFAPSAKIATTVSNTSVNIHQQLKIAEELKMMRKIPTLPEGGYELSPLIPSGINGARMSSMSAALHYAPKPQSLEAFPGTKGFPTPLLPFLPPSLAALSFPTQNWCAKCNASFRMTSDLVYHMRSHHKRETDPQKLKREEKLRCHICNETFRERHHLTRHMTSHQ
ncbi:uncharacterized protein LOC118189677 [Stegodyphus dumicola]|uniref:uncharacterized protein LOC118189677 n=1 Tax=Stegodyphus dumicola TaxID=202533 RepID=UPI0015AD6FD8|nr:uncharacterized protein LOC118189677 [Stegodyphus dumicola]